MRRTYTVAIPAALSFALVVGGCGATSNSVVAPTTESAGAAAAASTGWSDPASLGAIDPVPGSFRLSTSIGQSKNPVAAVWLAGNKSQRQAYGSGWTAASGWSTPKALSLPGTNPSDLSLSGSGFGTIAVWLADDGSSRRVQRSVWGSADGKTYGWNPIEWVSPADVDAVSPTVSNGADGAFGQIAWIAGGGAVTRVYSVTSAERRIVSYAAPYAVADSLASATSEYGNVLAWLQQREAHSEKTIVRAKVKTSSTKAKDLGVMKVAGPGRLTQVSTGLDGLPSVAGVSFTATTDKGSAIKVVRWTPDNGWAKPTAVSAAGVKASASTYTTGFVTWKQPNAVLAATATKTGWSAPAKLSTGTVNSTPRVAATGQTTTAQIVWLQTDKDHRRVFGVRAEGSTFATATAISPTGQDAAAPVVASPWMVGWQAGSPLQLYATHNSTK